MRGRPSLAPEEQFALLLDGDLSQAEVDEEIRALSELVAAVGQTPVPTAPPAFRSELRERLVAAAAASGAPPVTERLRDAVSDRTARWRHSLRVGVASAAASLMIGTAGMAVAAQQALPGELLYPVKQATESVRLALASDLEATGKLRLAFAEERLREVARGASDLSADLLIATLDAMDRASVAGVDDLLAWFAATEAETLLDDLDAFVDRQRAGLVEVLGDVPVAVVPYVERSLDVVRRIEQRVVAACACPAGLVPARAAPDILDGFTCDCVPVATEPIPRDPGVVVPEPPAGEDPPRESPPPDEGAPDPGDDPADPPDEGRVLVPELPGPLDPVGEEIDRFFNDLLGGSTDPVEDVVDDGTELVEDVLDDGVELVEDTVDEGVGDLLDD